MSDEEIENAIDTYFGNKDVADIQSVNDFINQFMYSQEGFLWSISNFGKFKKENSYTFAIIVIETWIKNQPDDVEPHLKEIFDILFEIAPKILTNPSKVILSRLSKAYVTFFLYTFKEKCQDIISSLVQLPSVLFYSFFAELTNYIHEHEEVTDINAYFDSNDYLNSIVSMLEKNILNEDQNALLPLSFALRWENSHISDQSCYLYLTTNILNIEDKESCLLVITAFIDTLSTDEICQFLAQYNLSSIFNEIITPETTQNVLSAIGSLVSTIGSKIIPSPQQNSSFFSNSSYIQHEVTIPDEVTPLIDIAQMIFESKYDDASESVIKFLNLICIDQDYAQRFLGIVFNRLKLDCSQRETDTSFTNVLLKFLVDICRIVKGETTNAFIKELYNNVPSDETVFPYVSAYFKLLNSLHENFITIDSIESYLDSFSQILEQKPPLNEAQLNCLLSFSMFFKSLSIYFSDKVKQAVIDALLAQVSGAQTDIVIDLLSKLLNDMLSNSEIKGSITISNDDLVTLTQSMNENFVSIVYSSIGTAEEKSQFSEVYNASLDSFIEKINSSEENEIVPVLNMMMKFMKECGYDDSFSEAATNGLSRIIQIVEENDYLLSVAYETVIYCLRDTRESVLSLVSPSGPESCSKLCMASSKYCSQELISSVIPISIQFLVDESNQISNWSENSEQVRIALDLHKNFFILASVLQNDSPLMENIINFALTVSDKLESPTPLQDVLKFFNKQGLAYLDVRFVNYAMNFPAARNFSTYHQWRLLIRVAFEFLKKVFRERNDLFNESLETLGENKLLMFKAISESESDNTELFEQVCKDIHSISCI